MLVYVLFHETNTGHSEESDGYVEGIFATERAAEQAMLDAIRKAIAAGERVYYDPDTERDFPEWDHDWRVEAHEVIPQLTCGQHPAATVRTCDECGEEVCPECHDRDTCGYRQGERLACEECGESFNTHESGSHTHCAKHAPE